MVDKKANTEKKIEPGVLVHLTNHGEALRLVTDVFGRVHTVKPGQQMAIEVSQRVAGILCTAANGADLLKVADSTGRPIEAPTDRPAPHEQPQSELLDANIAPPTTPPVSTPPAPPAPPAAAKPHKQQPTARGRVRPAPPARKPQPPAPPKSGTVTKEDKPPVNDNELTAAQVLARIGTTGFGYNELLQHGRRLIGADKLGPRPTEQDLLQRLRHLSAAGK